MKFMWSCVRIKDQWHELMIKWWKFQKQMISLDQTKPTSIKPIRCRKLYTFFIRLFAGHRYHYYNLFFPSMSFIFRISNEKYQLKPLMRRTNLRRSAQKFLNLQRNYAHTHTGQPPSLYTIVRIRELLFNHIM